MAVVSYLDLFIPKPDTRRDIFAGLQAMEFSTLDAIASKGQ